MFETTPRNWKWMVPAALSLGCLVLWQKAWIQSGMGDWAILLIGLVIIFGIAALVNGWAYVAQHWASMYAEMQVARNATAEVRMFEAAKGMHPEAVKALLVHRRMIWRMKYIPQKDVVDWILDEAPTVHAGFVDFVLDHSNGTLMSKRMLSEGSTKFDPDGLVTDYQQYDDLLWLLRMKMMCTEALGNQSPHFLPPWNVELLRKRFGLTGEGYEVDEEMSAAMKKVIASQSMVSDERSAVGARRLVEDVTPVQSTQKPVTSNQLPVEENIPPLNEEGMQIEMARYASQYSGGLPGSLQIKNKNS